MTTSLVIGSVPAVLVGSFLSSHAPDRYIRPVITFVIFASGLKYIGLGTTELGWVLAAVLIAAAAVWAAQAGLSRRNAKLPPQPASAPDPDVPSARRATHAPPD